MTFADRVRTILEAGRDRPALTTADGTLTFSQLRDLFDAWQRFLEHLEIAPGDRVALALSNSDRLVALHGGNLLSGRVTVPLNPSLPAAQIVEILERSEATLVVAEDELAEQLDGATTAHVLTRRFIDAALSSGARSPQRGAPPAITDDSLALLPFTSGTTGRPKGVRLTHGNLEASARALEAAWALGPADDLLLTLPLFHVHGLCVGIHGLLASGHHVTLLPRFDAAEVAARLAQPDGPTLFYGVPTLYARLVQYAGDAGSPWPRTRLAVSGSAPLSVELRERCRDLFGVDILERYGMTETLMNLSQPLDGLRRPGWLGQPLPGVSVRIVDEDGAEVADGCEGELMIKGPAVTPGYWRDEEADAAAFDDGWLRTGDLGLRDPDHGEHRITGRRKELIITGGMNVHPREVEECLAEHPAVTEAAVGGLPDDDLGEAVSAWIVAASDVTAEELIDWCRERLAPYRKPRRVFFVSELPRNALGKIQRHELRAPAEEETR